MAPAETTRTRVRLTPLVVTDNATGPLCYLLELDDFKARARCPANQMPSLPA